MKSSIRLSIPWLASFLVIASALPMRGQAAALEEIVVTAQKRQQSIEDVGISITAMSGDQLKALNMTSTTDIIEQVPAMQLYTYSPQFTVFSLRGISQNNFQDNLEAPVAVYMDNAYVASMNAISGQLFDMKRVEILRGPQGTLFGRNTTGGLIHYLSRGADEDQFNGYMQASVSEYNKHSVEGAFGGKITDHLRGRFAGRWEQADGYIKSITPGVRDAQGANGFALRGSLQADVTSAVTADLKLYYSKDTDVPTGAYYIGFATFDPATGFGIPQPGALSGKLQDAATLQGGFSRKVFSTTGTVKWELDNGLEVTSITNYLKLDKNYLEDSASGLGYFPYSTTAHFDQKSEEARISRNDGNFRWQAGVYYLDMKWNLSQSVAGALILGGTSDTQKMTTPAVLDSTNWSLFGQAEYDLAPRWTIIAGLRWSQDNKSIDMTRIYQDIPNGVPPTEVFNIATSTGIPGINKIDYGDVAARVQLNWKPDDDTLLYVSFNRGIKGGNWSEDPLGAVAYSNLKHGPETLYAYEAGIKRTFLDGRARINADGYYYDYHDYQTFSLVGLTPQVANSPAHSYGGEIELALTPAQGWDFNFGAAFIHSHVNAVPDVFGGTVSAEFPLAPAVNLNWLGRYEWPAFGGNLAVQIDGDYNSDQYLEGTNSAVSKEPAYSVWNGSLSYTTMDEKWKATLWVKNFTDTRHRLYELDLGLIGFHQDVYAPPRWVGGTVSYQW